MIVNNTVLVFGPALIVLIIGRTLSFPDYLRSDFLSINTRDTLL
jgi:hypothetical protein